MYASCVWRNKDDVMNETLHNNVAEALIKLNSYWFKARAGKKKASSLTCPVKINFRHGRGNLRLAMRKKIFVNKHQLRVGFFDFSPKINLRVKNTHAGKNSENKISLTFFEYQAFLRAGFVVFNRGFMRNVDSLLSQQLLTHMAAKPQSLCLSWSEEEGVGLVFGPTQGVHA